MSKKNKDMRLEISTSILQIKLDGFTVHLTLDPPITEERATVIRKAIQRHNQLEDENKRLQEDMENGRSILGRLVMQIDKLMGNKLNV